MRGVRVLLLRLTRLALLALVLVAPPAAQAAAPAGVESATREIARSLRCPVCEGLSVADSPTALAAEMRALIRKKVAAGESAEEIVAYFVERYGEEVALVPRRQGLGLALWWGPVAIFVLGGAVVARSLWGGRRPDPPAAAGAGEGGG